MREWEGLTTMTVISDRLGVRGDNVVRGVTEFGVTEFVDLFRYDATDIMNHLVPCGVDVAKHTNPRRAEVVERCPSCFC